MQVVEFFIRLGLVYITGGVVLEDGSHQCHAGPMLRYESISYWVLKFQKTQWIFQILLVAVWLVISGFEGGEDFMRGVVYTIVNIYVHS